MMLSLLIHFVLVGFYVFTIILIFSIVGRIVSK